MRWLLLLISCCWWGNNLVAQELSPRVLKKAGETFFENYRYHEAYSNLQQYYQLAPNDDDIWEKLGIAAYHVNQLEVAAQVLRPVSENNRLVSPDALLFLAKTYQLLHDFANATQIYKQFLLTTKSTHPLRAMVKDELRRCGYAIRRNYQEPSVIVENLGTSINGQWDDFAPVLSPLYTDRLYFSSIRADNLGGLRNDAGFQDEERGFYRADMYSSNIVNGNWNTARPMTALLNSPRHDVVLDFSSNGQVMYYFQGFNSYAGEILVDTFKTLEERTLTTSKLESSFQPQNGDTAPFFYDDSTMIFASRRAGGYGGLDLYWTTKKDGIWVAAKNLGATVNSAYDETTPFLATDGRTLYFSSNHSQRSRGDYDIFKTTLLEETGEWTSPQNLGQPINSAGDDRYFRLTKDGYNAFFSSRRKGSLGGLDIYSVYFKNYQSEQQNSNNKVVFHELIKRLEGEENDLTTATDLPVYTIAPLLFENENNLFSTQNKQQLQQIISILQQYPRLKVLITAHSDDSEPEKFDLFFSIKRAERIGLFLLENGISTEQIILHGVGGKYPLAKTEIAGNPNLIGQKLNRRITLDILNLADEPLRVMTEYPTLNPKQATFEHKFHQKLNEGLCYRIQIATSPQMYKGDLIVRYPHALVEKSMGTTRYQYFVGRYQTYASARELQKDLATNGVTDARIMAYLNGQRLTLSESAEQLSEYPDLVNFIEAAKK